MRMRNQLFECLDAFQKAENISLLLLDEEGNIQEQFGERPLFCELFYQSSQGRCPCSKTRHFAVRQAAQIGDAYIYVCPGNVVNFAIPLYRLDKRFSCVMAGPVLLDYPEIEMADEVIQKQGLAVNMRQKLFQAMRALPLIEPYRLRYLSKLLFLLLNPSGDGGRQNLPAETALFKTQQQAEISEHIHAFKDESEMRSAQFELEDKLLEAIRSGREQESNALLNEILGRIYFTSGNNIQIIRTRAIELVTVISRSTKERGGDREAVYQINEALLQEIAETTDLIHLSFLLADALKQFSSMAFPHVKQINLEIMKKAVDYIHSHYALNPSLQEVAEHVNLNPSYFSTLFKAEWGENFSRYLNQLRVKHAESLLQSSNLSIAAIAAKLGFVSQSYFAKVFKEIQGMSPSDYRKR